MLALDEESADIQMIDLLHVGLGYFEEDCLATVTLRER